MTPFYTSAEEIETLVKGFNTKTLEKEKWTHEAHLTAATWYLKNYSLDEATNLVRNGIKEYNVTVGGTNTSTSGYHETMTIFWMAAIYFFVNRDTSKSLLDTCNELLASPLAERTLPFEFYERETILSTEARAAFVKPDKEDLNDEALENILKNKG